MASAVVVTPDFVPEPKIPRRWFATVPLGARPVGELLEGVGDFRAIEPMGAVIFPPVRPLFAVLKIAMGTGESSEGRNDVVADLGGRFERWLADSGRIDFSEGGQ